MWFLKLSPGVYYLMTCLNISLVKILSTLCTYEIKQWPSVKLIQLNPSYLI